MKSWAKQINKSSFLEKVDEEEVEEKLAEGLELYERKSAEKPSITKETTGEICMSCFMTKPLTGVCPNCDE